MAGRLRAKQIATLKQGKRHGDGGGLYLVCEKAPSKSRHWILRTTINGRRTDLGLGGWPFVGLAEARDLAYEARREARRGGDPRRKAMRPPSFRAAALAVERASDWAKTSRINRRAALESYCARLLDLRVDQIERADVLRILSPIWIDKAATARRLRGWIREVLAWAEAHGHVERNMAGEAISGALPKNRRTGKGERSHHAALAYQEVPGALEAVESGDGTEATKGCIAFIALTACRSGEARLADWREVDMGGMTWRIPAERMKARREHRVPLSAEAFAILERMGPRVSGPIFRGPSGRALSPSVLLKAWRRAVPGDTTIHGLRSAFRTWAAEEAATTRDVAEMCLAHVVGSEIERSYQRSTLFQKRRALMAAWAAHCCPR